MGRNAQVILQILIFLGGGIGLGYCSADYAMTRGLRTVSVSNGPWTTWPSVASQDADPYTRAHFAGTGKLALTSFEAITFRAETDGEGDSLDLTCTYSIGSGALSARWWSITVYGHDGRPIANPADRHSFNSTNTVRKTDGSFLISVSGDVQAGNWIPVMGSGDFFILLRLYNADRRLSGNLEGAALPTITREKCS